LRLREINSQVSLVLLLFTKLFFLSCQVSRKGRVLTIKGYHGFTLTDFCPPGLKHPFHLLQNGLGGMAIQLKSFIACFLKAHRRISSLLNGLYDTCV